MVMFLSDKGTKHRTPSPFTNVQPQRRKTSYIFQDYTNITIKIPIINAKAVHRKNINECGSLFVNKKILKLNSSTVPAVIQLTPYSGADKKATAKNAMETPLIRSSRSTVLLI